MLYPYPNDIPHSVFIQYLKFPQSISFENLYTWTMVRVNKRQIKFDSILYFTTIFRFGVIHLDLEKHTNFSASPSVDHFNVIQLYARPGGIINSRPSLPLDFKFFNSGVMSLDLPARFKFYRFPFNTLQM